MHFISILKFHICKLLLIFYYIFFRPDKHVELGLLILNLDYHAVHQSSCNNSYFHHG